MDRSQRHEAKRLLMRQLRARRAAMGIREHQLWAHDADWPVVREYAVKLLLRRMADDAGEKDET